MLSNGYEIFCPNVAPSEITNVFRRTVPIELPTFTMKGSTETEKELHLPAQFLASHKFESLNLYCLNSNNINSTTFQPKLTIHRDAFASTRNFTENILMEHCDLSRLNFTFLDGFSQLKRLSIDHSSNVGMADWGSLPPLPSLQHLFIKDDETNPNNSWPDNLSPLKFGIFELFLVGMGFSGDEMAYRIVQWLHQSSAETLTYVKFKNWGNLTRIPHLLRFLYLDSLDIICGNFDRKKNFILDFIAFKSPSTTDEMDGFRSIEFLSIKDCDMNQLDFTFLLKGIKKLKEFKTHQSSNSEMVADWDILPPLEKLIIEDENINPNKSWADTSATLKFGISNLSLVGVGFSGDETADRILQWIHQSSAETLTHVEFSSWGNLNRIPRRLSSFKKMESLEILCDNFELPIIGENSIVFNVPIRLFSLENCGVKEIKPNAFQGIGPL